MRPSLLALAALCVLVAISAAAAAGGPPPKAGFTAATRADSGETSKGQNEPQVTVDQQGTASFRQSWDPFRAIEERHAQRGFERLYRLAHRRLHTAQPSGGGREAAGLGDRDQDTQVIESEAV